MYLISSGICRVLTFERLARDCRSIVPTVRNEKAAVSGSERDAAVRGNGIRNEQEGLLRVLTAVAATQLSCPAASPIHRLS